MVQDFIYNVVFLFYLVQSVCLLFLCTPWEFGWERTRTRSTVEKTSVECRATETCVMLQFRLSREIFRPGEALVRRTSSGWKSVLPVYWRSCQVDDGQRPGIRRWGVPVSGGLQKVSNQKYQSESHSAQWVEYDFLFSMAIYSDY